MVELDPEGAGLRVAYSGLAWFALRYRRSLAVSLEDPVGGRQVFAVDDHGARCLRPRVGDHGTRWAIDPPLEPVPPELPVVAALVVAVVRACRAAAAAGDPDLPLDDVAELRIRALPGVYGVARRGTGSIVQIAVTHDAPAEVGERVREVLATTDDPPALEVLRDAVPPDGGDVAGAPDPGARVELAALRADAGGGDLEIHLRRLDARAVGRAAVDGGVAAAARATLDALSGLDVLCGEHANSRHLEWARIVETIDRRFVVAASVRTTSGTRYGVASGASFAEAAALATLEAAVGTAPAEPHGAAGTVGDLPS